jgi:hypothetical protein
MYRIVTAATDRPISSTKEKALFFGLRNIKNEYSGIVDDQDIEDIISSWPHLDDRSKRKILNAYNHVSETEGEVDEYDLDSSLIDDAVVTLTIAIKDILRVKDQVLADTYVTSDGEELTEDDIVDIIKDINYAYKKGTMSYRNVKADLAELSDVTGKEYTFIGGRVLEKRADGKFYRV